MRDPPPIVQCLCEIVSQRLRDSIAEGGIAPICLVFMWYRGSIAEIPFWGVGDVAPPLRTLRTGETLRKGGCTQLAILRHQKPQSAQ